MRPLRAVAVAVAAIAVAAVPAQAQWSAPRSIGPAAPAVVPAALLVHASPADGRLLLGWQTRTTTGTGSYVAASTQAERGTRLPENTAHPVAAARGRVLYLRGRSTKGYRMDLGVSVGGFDGSPGRRHAIATFLQGGDIVGAASPRGDFVVAWTEDQPTTNRYGPTTRRIARYAYRRAGSTRWSRPLVLADLGIPEHPGITSLDVALTPRGHLVGAVSAFLSNFDGVVWAVTGTPGHTLHRRRVGSHRGISNVAVAVAATGRAGIAWDDQDGGEERNVPLRVSAVIREGGTSVWRRSQLLDPGVSEDYTPGALVLRAATDGTLAAMWTNVSRHAYPTYVAVARPGHGFGARELLDPNGIAGDLAFDRHGDLLAVWSRALHDNYQHPDQLFAAVRRTDSTAFGAPERVSGDEAAALPRAAFRADGRAVVIWSGRPGVDPANVSSPRVDARLRVAERAAP